MKIREEGLSWQELDGEVVVLDLTGSIYLRINGSGTILWRRLAEGADRDALVASLTDAFEVDETQAGSDVDAFVADLRAKGLLADAG